MKQINELDKVVRDMLETHQGGEIFFNHLDEAIRNNLPIIDSLMNLIPFIKDKNIIVSGNFGRFFVSYLNLIGLKVKTLICVQGGLRLGNEVIFYDIDMVKNKDFIFIDDSFYSGKTRNAIEKELNNYNSKISMTYVAYDGSINFDKNVISLYRYYKRGN